MFSITLNILELVYYLINKTFTIYKYNNELLNYDSNIIWIVDNFSDVIIFNVMLWFCFLLRCLELKIGMLGVLNNLLLLQFKRCCLNNILAFVIKILRVGEINVLPISLKKK